MRRRYIVAYDIRDEKRLGRVYRYMKGIGDQLQYSVYLCDLDDEELVDVSERFGNLINEREDSVIFVDLGPLDENRKFLTERMRFLGVKPLFEEHDHWVV